MSKMKQEEHSYRSFESYKERFFETQRRCRKRTIPDDPSALGALLAHRSLKKIKDLVDESEVSSHEDESGSDSDLSAP